MKIYRLILIVLFIALSTITGYLPNIIANDSKVFIFALMCVELLKEFAWYELKKSCKNSKDSLCKIFKRNKVNNHIEQDKAVEIMLKRNIAKIEEKTANEAV